MIKNFKNIEINYDDNKTLNVEYSLIESIFNNNNVYGFKIKSIDLNTQTYDNREFLDFTKDLAYAKIIFDFLVINKVLPANLINVLDDIIL